MAIAATTLWSLDTVRAWLGATASGKDTQLEQIANGVTALIERETGRIFVQRAITEKRDGDGSSRLWLRRAPVVSIASITVLRQPTDSAAETFDAGDYRFNMETGKIEAHDEWFTRGLENVTVTYTAGLATQDGTAFTAVPDAEQLWHAAFGIGLEMITYIQQETMSGSTGATSVQVGPASFSVKPDWPKAVKAGLRALKRPVV